MATTFNGISLDVTVPLITTVQQEIANTAGVTAFTTAGAFLSIPGNRLKANGSVDIDCLIQCTQAVDGGNVTPYLWWGGAAGVMLMVTQGVALSTGDHFYLRATVVHRTIGASPVWDSTSLWHATVNQSFDPIFPLFGQTTQPTNAAITIAAGVNMTNASAANKMKLTWLRARLSG